MIGEVEAKLGINEGMLRALADGKADSLTVRVPENEDPQEIWSVIQALIAQYPNIKAVVGEGEKKEILFTADHSN